MPSPYNKTIQGVKIKITKASDNLTARSSCSEVCFHWTTDIALMDWTESQCFTICSYDGPIMNSDPSSGSTSCSLCGGGLGSTSSSSGGGSSSYTALDGAIYNGSLLSDLSAALEPDGMPLADFERKYPDYVYLIAPLREIKQKLGDLDGSDIEMYVRYPNILTQANSFFNKHGVSEKTREFMRAYNDSFKTDEEFKAMVTAPIPAFVWDIAFDISLEVVEKIVKKFVPAAELSEDVINLIKALKGDDWMDLLYKAGELAWDTAKTLNPQLKMFDTAKEAFSLYNKFKKIQEPLEAIYNKVDAATFKKIYAAMSKMTNRNIFDKFQFLDESGYKNLKFFGSAKDLIYKLSSEFGISVSDLTPTVINPLNKTFGFQAGNIFFSYYKESDTSGTPTIHIAINGYGKPTGAGITIIKIRQ